MQVSPNVAAIFMTAAARKCLHGALHCFLCDAHPLGHICVRGMIPANMFKPTCSHLPPHITLHTTENLLAMNIAKNMGVVIPDLWMVSSNCWASFA